MASLLQGGTLPPIKINTEEEISDVEKTKSKTKSNKTRDVHYTFYLQAIYSFSKHVSVTSIHKVLRYILWKIPND